MYTCDTAIADLRALHDRIDLLATLTSGEDAQAEPGEPNELHDQYVSLKRGHLATMFIEIGDEVLRIQQALAALNNE